MKTKRTKKKGMTLSKLKRRIANLRNRIVVSENYLTAISTPKETSHSCKKTPKTERTDSLLRRAVDSGASEEEARTSAVLAARLIKKEGLKICG